MYVAYLSKYYSFVDPIIVLKIMLHVKYILLKIFIYIEQIMICHNLASLCDF